MKIKRLFALKIKRLFALELIEDGYHIPRWYLPLYRDFDTRSTVCYLVWFWPFAAVWLITRGALRHVALDMYDMIYELDIIYRNRNKKKGVIPWLK